MVSGTRNSGVNSLGGKPTIGRSMPNRNVMPPERGNWMKKVAKLLLDKSLVPLVAYTRSKTIPAHSYTVIDELDKRALGESADYAQQYMRTAISFRDKKELWEFALGKVSVQGIVAEFGVWNGASLNYIARAIAKKQGPDVVYGFD